MTVLWMVLFMISTVYSQIGTRCYYKETGMHGTCQQNMCEFSVFRKMSELRIFKICDGPDDSVCCIHNEYVNPTEDNSTAMANRIKSVSFHKCMKYSNMTINLLNKNFEDKIAYGSNTSIGEFPHMAALGTGTINNITWVCGGSLISERFILTAAHCFKANIKYVLLGNTVLNNTDRNNLFKIRNIFIHPDYKPDEVYNDIALLELHKEVEFTSVIKPACLSIDEALSELEVTGWGRTERARSSEVLLKTSLRLLNNVKCSNISVLVERMPKGLQDTQMCALSSGHNDTCEGDSGGPLQAFHFRYKLYNVLGITSNGLPKHYCGIPDVPGLYTRVSSYLTWIENIVWPISIRTSDTKCEEFSKQLLGLTIEGSGDKIFGGRNASEGEFPHMAALGYGKVNDIKWLCGGSLISDKFILTAAHCRYSQEYGEVQYVQLGFIAINEKPKASNFFYINKIHVHEQYRAPSIYHDIALIELARPVIFSGRIKPACLYTEYFRNLEHNTLVATGWGLTSYSGSYSEILQAVDLKLYENCKNYYGVNNRKFNESILGSQLCAGSEEQKDTCQGDSGGPLQVLDFKKKLHVVVGLTSAGGVCGSSRPALYTRVSSYTDWIESIVWPRSIHLLVNDVFSINYNKTEINLDKDFMYLDNYI